MAYVPGEWSPVQKLGVYKPPTFEEMNPVKGPDGPPGPQGPPYTGPPPNSTPGGGPPAAIGAAQVPKTTPPGSGVDLSQAGPVLLVLFLIWFLFLR